jgi:hypothetical protein
LASANMVRQAYSRDFGRKDKLQSTSRGRMNTALRRRKRSTGIYETAIRLMKE